MLYTYRLPPPAGLGWAGWLRDLLSVTPGPRKLPGATGITRTVTSGLKEPRKTGVCQARSGAGKQMSLAGAQGLCLIKD